jgi:peroxiredoxin Q/BCP
MSRFSGPGILLAAAAIATVGVASEGAASAALEVGDAAPDFTLPGSDGKETTLSSFAGEKNVVLAFFPKAFTGG